MARKIIPIISVVAISALGILFLYDSSSIDSARLADTFDLDAIYYENQGIVEISFTDNSQKTNSESAERHTTISNPTPSRDSSPTTILTKTQTTQTFETLSLKTTQQLDDTVMLHYEDTSGKTISVTVILRTTEKDLFIGTFYSSMFEASVNDATKTSYFIDMIVEHEDYGTIVSSVFNPVDTPDTIINGVFSQS